MIKILLIDSHELMRTGLKYMLADVKGVKVIGEAINGEDGIKMAKQLEPDMVIMDVNLPKINGLEVVARILRVNPEIKILVVAACEELVYPTRLLEIGVFGYLTQRASFKELVHAIQGIAHGQRYVSQELAQNLLLEKVGVAHDKNQFDKLSNKELQIALFVGKGTKPQEIADLINISSKTVNSYRYRIFKKLRIKSDVELVKLLLKHGLIEN
jgi:two-component system, NarL family, invasion response regulator UvrY